MSRVTSEMNNYDKLWLVLSHRKALSFPLIKLRSGFLIVLRNHFIVDKLSVC